MSPTPRPSWPDLAVAVALAVQLVVLLHPLAAASLSRFVVADDLAQQVAPFERFVDPGAEASSGDLLGDFALAYDPPGYAALFVAWSRVADPVTAAKILDWGLRLGTIGLLAALGTALGGRVGLGALLAAWIVNLGFPFTYGTGGLPRSFSLPLALLWLVGAVRGRGGARLAAVLGAALFYTPAVVPLGLAELVERGLEARRTGWRDHRAAIAVLGLAAAVVLVQQTRLSPYGPLLAWSEVKHMPELHPGGRFPVFPLPSPLAELSSHLAGNARGTIDVGGFTRTLVPFLEPATLLGLGLLPFAIRRRSRELGILVRFLGATLVAYVAARALAYRLYVPNRMLVAWPIVGPALVLLAAGELTRRIAARSGKDPLLAVVAVLVAAVLAGGGLSGEWVRRGGLTAKLDGEADLFAAIRDLPPGSLVAGPLRLLDFVPLFGHRSVLANGEMMQPLQRRYYEAYRRRVTDLTTAYFARDRQELREFAARYGVTHALVSLEEYAVEGAPFPVYPPYGGVLAAADDRSGRIAGRPLLAHPGDPAVVFRRRGTALVDLAKLLEGPDPEFTIGARPRWRRFLPLPPADRGQRCELVLRVRRLGAAGADAVVTVDGETVSRLTLEEDRGYELPVTVDSPASPITTPPRPSSIEVHAEPLGASIGLVPGAARCDGSPAASVRTARSSATSRPRRRSRAPRPCRTGPTASRSSRRRRGP